MAALRILVVEDDKHIRRILESLLTKEPSLAARSPEIVVAADGQDGMVAIEKGPFDLVITDLLMPRMDGFQFCRELRKHRFGGKVPVIVTSAIFKDHAAQIRIREAVGDHHFFAKPYEIRDLVNTVNRIFDGGKPLKKAPTPAIGVPIVADKPESGSLAERTPARVLLDLSDRKVTGTLTVTRGKVKKDIGLQNGVLTTCDSNLRNETLGHFLVSRGVIDEAQHQTALGRAQAQKERLGQALIELGWMNEADLLKQLGAQMRAKVAGLLRWNDGTWSFVPGAPPTARLQTPVEAPKLVFLGLQKTAHVDEIAQLMAAVRGRVGLTSRAERHRDTFMRVFGTLGLEALARRPLVEDLMSGTDPVQMLTHLDALLACGLAELEPAGVAKLSANEATDPVALERISRPAAIVPPPPPPPQKNHYDDLFTEEPSEVKSPRPQPKADAEALRKEILAEYLPLATRTHYPVLGVSPSANGEQIAAAHAGLLQRFRLERFTDAELGADYAHVEALHQSFARAIETLGSLKLRAEYDRSLAARKQPSAAPIDAELCASQAATLLASGNAAGARAKLEAAVASAPDEAHYRAQLAWASFLAAGGAEPKSAASAARIAQPHLDQALAIDADSADALDFAGRIAAAAGDDERAIAHLERALDAQPQRVEALTALETIYTGRDAWELLERRYRKLIHRLGEGRDPLRVSLWTRLAELYQLRLGDSGSAKVAYDVLAKLTGSRPQPTPTVAPPTPTVAPPTPTVAPPTPAVAPPTPAVAPPTPAVAPLAPTRPAEAQFADHFAAERWDAVLVAASACPPTDAAAAEFYRRYRPRFLQRAAPLGPAQLAAVRHPDDDADLGQLLTQVFAVEPPPFTLADLRVTPADLISPTGPFARVLAHTAALFGITPPAIYRRADLGSDATVGALRPPILIVGPQLLALTDPFALAFRLGRALSLSPPGRAVASSLPSRQLKELLLAALTLVTPQLKVEDADGAIAKKREQLAATAPQLAREIAPLVDKLRKSPQGALNLTRFSRGLSRTADRTGLTACNDPAVALRLVAASGAAGAVEELTAWALSEPYLLLRDQLGLSVAV